ncbi:hypothetical protein ACFQ48_07330 [Hymenobacter caeli]|uniref:Uncharacterized protein n=1 Tax=Hymenobacter caeli TaxID=2735894 RepID=A0ABX2FLN5_9BACT|nr:hypothetical protein [Hymenobacter caeli]NRT18053.1 hypothetical protein [Hymenobacter caeli]
MKPPKFHEGQAVVCVNDDFSVLLAQNPHIRVPRSGPTYHVRELYAVGAAWGLTLAEIDNQGVAPGYPEANFHQDRFAPLEMMPDEALAELLAESLELQPAR